MSGDVGVHKGAGLPGPLWLLLAALVASPIVTRASDDPRPAARVMSPASADTAAAAVELALANARPSYDRYTLVAAVPDPSDPRLADLFDASIGALQAAATNTGFVLDRFFFPWPAPGEPGRKTEGPGALV